MRLAELSPCLSGENLAAIREDIASWSPCRVFFFGKSNIRAGRALRGAPGTIAYSVLCMASAPVLMHVAL